MSNMNGNDPNRVLNETRDIDRAIDSLEQELERLKMLQNRHVDDTDIITIRSDILLKIYCPKEIGREPHIAPGAG